MHIMVCVFICLFVSLCWTLVRQAQLTAVKTSWCRLTIQHKETGGVFTHQWTWWVFITQTRYKCSVTGLLSLTHPWFGFRANRCGILQTRSQKTCRHCWSSPWLRTKVPLDLLTPPQRKMRQYHNKYHNWMKTCRGIDIRPSKLHHFGKEFKNIHSPPPTSRLQEAERRCYELKKEMELLKGEIQHLKNSKETGKESVPFFLTLASSSSSFITVGDLRIPHHMLKNLCVTAVYQEPSWVQMQTKEQKNGRVQF